MDYHDPVESHEALRFLEQYARDREDRVRRSLEDYLALFPGFPHVIRQEYAALQKETETTKSRRERAEEVFHAAVSLPADERKRFLARECAGDAALRGDVERLFRAHDGGMEAFLDEPAVALLANGSDEPDESPDRLPKVIAHYRIEREIGRGGHGVVFRAEDTRLHRPVALKVLAGPFFFAETMRNRLLREAEAASKLDHPGICSIYELGEEGGVPFIAMRYIEGEPLSRKIAAAQGGVDSREGQSFIDLSEARETACPEKAAPPTPSTGPSTQGEVLRVAALIEQAARALHVAHEASLIHRDIKPGNIMVTEEGEPVILDFGLARVEESDQPTLTRSGQLLGTPAYMSPEQLTASRIALDRRTDVYSLGVTLYECLTLRRPFDGATREQLYQRILTAEPPDPRRLNANIPKDLRVILETALDKDRDRRYQTALDLAEDLRRMREHEPTRARPVGLLGRMVRYAKRRPARAALVATLVVCVPLVAAMGGYIVASRPIVEAQRRQEDREAVEGHLRDGFGQLLHGDSARSLAFFESALALETDSAEAVFGKAMALLQARSPAACLEVLDAHEASKPPVPALQRLRAHVLRIAGRPDEAAAAEARLPASMTALESFLEGMCLMRDCQSQRDSRVFRRALEHFNRAALTTPHARALYHIEVAHAAGHLEDEASARRVADALTTLWPHLPDAWYWAGYALQKVDVDESIAAYQKATALKPDHALAILDMGFALSRKGDDRAAIVAFRKAIAAHPDLAKAHQALGWALFKDGDTEGAISAYRRAIALKPDLPTAHSELGDALTRKGRLDAAIAACSRAIALKPDFGRAYHNLGVALHGKGETDEAVGAWRKAIELEPTLAAPYNSLGIALLERGDLVEAIAAHRRATALKPGHSLFHYSLANALLRKGELDASVAAYRRAIALKPDDAEAHCALGKALLEKGDPQAAISACRKAIGLEPDHAKAHVNLAAALAASNDLAAAIVACRKAIGLKPDLADAHYNLGSALLGKQDLDGAIAAFSRVIELNPDDTEAHNHLGIALSRKGDMDAAIVAWQTAVRLRPDFASPWYDIGLALMARDDRRGAIAAFKKVIALMPHHAEPYNNLGILLGKSGKLDAAVASIKKSIELRPDYAHAYCSLGTAYKRMGAYDKALAAYRRGHGFRKRMREWRFDSARWIRETERLLLKDARNAALVGFADISTDAPAGVPKEALRKKAVAWIRTALDGWREAAEADAGDARRIARVLDGLLRDPGLLEMQESPHFLALAEPDRRPWLDLRDEMVALLERVKKKE